MNSTDFIGRTLKDAQAKIVLTNLVAELRSPDKAIDPDLAALFIRWWKVTTPLVDALHRRERWSPAESIDAYFYTAQRTADWQHVFAKLINELDDDERDFITANGPKPNFLLQGPHPTEPIDARIQVNVTTFEGGYKRLSRGTRLYLAGRGVVPPDDSATRQFLEVTRTRPVQIPLPMLSFDDSSTLGNPATLLWTTSFLEFEKGLINYSVDTLRDRLGLVHINKSESPMAFTFSRKKPRPSNVPTALDLIGRRFRVHIPEPVGSGDGWGRTVDLEKFACEHPSSWETGLKERVNEPLDIDSELALEDSVVFPQLNSTRGGRERLENDNRYLDHLMAELAVNDSDLELELYRAFEE